MNLRERSHSIKLSDDELVNQFDRKSLNEKLELFKRVLRKSHQTFSDLIIKSGFTTHQEITAMGRYGKERPNKSLTILYGKMRMDFFHYLRKRSRSMKGLQQALWRLFAPSLTCSIQVSKPLVDLVGITFLMYAISGLLVLVRTTFTSFRKPANRQSSSKESGSRPSRFQKCFKRAYAFRNDRPQSTTKWTSSITRRFLNQLLERAWS